MSDVVEIKVVTGSDCVGCTHETLYIDGNEVMSAYPLYECPEDAMLERDMLGPSDFVELLKLLLVNHKGKKLKFIFENEEE